MADSRDELLRVRVTKGGLAAVDSHRGGWSRSEYVRQALVRAVQAGMKGPDTGEVDF